MFIIELTYKKSLAEADTYLQGHRDFLDRYYEQGLFLASGPKHPREGGVILAQGEREHIEAIVKEDPFYQQGIADYRIIELVVRKACAELSFLLAPDTAT